MSTFICKSCGGTYQDRMPDGTEYSHACPSETVTHQVTDAQGKEITAETRAPRPNMRNENVRSNLRIVDGELFEVVPDPETPSREKLVPTQRLVLHEGEGRTKVA